MNNTTVRLGLRATLALMALATAFSEVSAQAKKTIQKPVAAKSAALPSTPLSSAAVGGLMVQVQPGSGDCEDGEWNEADSTCNPNNDSPGAGGGGNTLPPVVVTSPPKPPTMPPPPPPTTQPSEGTSPTGGGGVVPPKPPKSEEQKEKERLACRKTKSERMDIFKKTWEAELARCASAASDPITYFTDELAKLFKDGCTQRVMKWHDDKVFDINLEEKQCLAKAEEP